MLLYVSALICRDLVLQGLYDTFIRTLYISLHLMQAILFHMNYVTKYKSNRIND